MYPTPLAPSFRLLGSEDPPPVSIVNGSGASPFVLTCEHAARAVPAALGDLGVPTEAMAMHVGWDIGALGVAEALSGLLDAPLVIQRYSRLVIDSNRPWGSGQLIPAVSDTVRVPGNERLTPEAKAARWHEIHQPFHRAIDAMLDERPGSRLVSVHSFTPRLMGRPEDPRPWRLGLLYGRNGGFAEEIVAALGREADRLNTGFNVPYTVEDDNDYTIPVHCDARGVPGVLLEIRNDEISGKAGQTAWARLLAKALSRISETAPKR